jgi:hypothetical protein
MASGSYEIDTYSWYRSLPLNGCTEAYSTGTMFAVGPCAFLQPYTFYQYQSSLGFTDTSTMSVSLTSFVCTSLMSTTISLQSSIYLNRRQIVSTIPLTKWISTNSAGGIAETTDYPFFYASTFKETNINFQSTYFSSISSFFQSTGLFGFINSNIYPTCSPYSLFSSIPILNSTFFSTIGSTFLYGFTSTIPSTLVSSVAARPEIFDFSLTSSFTSQSIFRSDFPIRFPNFWLGQGLQSLIDTRTYDVIVDMQYSLFVSTNNISSPFSVTNYVWVSSVGIFDNTPLGSLGQYTGVTSRTRAGNCNFMEVYNKQVFHPTKTGIKELAFNNSNYGILFNAIPTRSTTEVFVDVYMPGTDNMTITLVPTLN